METVDDAEKNLECETPERTSSLPSNRGMGQPLSGQRFPRLKTINSHVGCSRLMDEFSLIGWIARCQCEAIPSPYASSPSKQVFEWKGKRVVLFETSHKRYEVFQVPNDMPLFKTDNQATDYHIAARCRA